MVRFVLVEADPPSHCGATRGRRRRVRCELPPDHITGRNHTPMYEINHFGRGPAGRWYSWPPDTQGEQ